MEIWTPRSRPPSRQPPPRLSSFPPHALSEILDAYPAAVRPDGPIEALGHAGGLSGSRIWRYAAASGGRFALRAWPLGGFWDRTRLRWIHGWLARSQSDGLTAVPIADLRGATIHEDREGRFWELAPWLDGAADLSRPPGDAKLQAGFQGLARLHRAWADSSVIQASDGLVQRVAELDEWRRFGFGELRRLLNLRGDNDDSRMVRRWLALAEPFAREIELELRQAVTLQVPIQPVLCDVHGAHLLFMDDRLTGIVDYGAMTIDSVARDLARLLAEWVGPDPAARDRALDAYVAARPLSTAELRLVPVFERSGGLLLGGRWARRLMEPNADPDDTDRAGLGRGIRRLEEQDEPRGGLRVSR